jgi:hypothetical protein
MVTRAEELITQIKKLVDELFALSHKRAPLTEHSANQKKISSKKGAAGAISMLIEEGFFNSPKDLQSVLEKLKEIGRYYAKGLVSMNLLNLTRRRVMNRIKEGDNKKWKYVIRR